MATITNGENPELFGLEDRATKTKVNKLGADLLTKVETRKAAEALEEKAKLTIRPLARQAYFEDNEDSTVREGNIDHTYDFAGFQVNFVNKYYIKDEAHARKIENLLGVNHPLARQIKLSRLIVVDVSNINGPQLSTYNHELNVLNRRYGVTGTVTEQYVVTDKFHDLRHELLTAEDNLTLDALLPVQVAFTIVD